LHATFRLSNAEGEDLGLCVLCLTDDEGNPLKEQRNVEVPLVLGGCLTGYLTCDISLTQLLLDTSVKR
jgi:hypothetical protein